MAAQSSASRRLQGTLPGLAFARHLERPNDYRSLVAPRYRIRPSRSSAALGAVVGTGITIVGATQVSSFGAFGVLWTLAALAATVYYAMIAIGMKGLSAWDIDDEAHAAADPQTRLERLESLRAEGTITEAEYSSQRAKIVADL
jgi:hypothetical protein